jgi:hypothetical protein
MRNFTNFLDEAAVQAGRAQVNERWLGKQLARAQEQVGRDLEAMHAPILLAMAKKMRTLAGVPAQGTEFRESLNNAADFLRTRARRVENGEPIGGQAREQAAARHQDRRELRGGGNFQMEDKAKLGSWFISQVLPQGASDAVKRKAREQLKGAKYSDLDAMREAAKHILDNWGSDFAQNHALVKHLGYDRDGLKKLEKLVKRKLQNVNGRRYHDDVLRIANQYDLESEDADTLYDWRADKPPRGRALSDQEKMNRFMAKAKPETRERMQGMNLADFMVMYKAILKEVLEDEEDAQAA